jgi:NADPH:quinone reductase-like Zn-dependent oxidoreductase
LLISAQAAWAPSLFAEAESSGVRASAYLVEPDACGLEALAALVNTGELKPHVQTVLPLEDAAEAQQIVASRRVAGKVVLKV